MIGRLSEKKAIYSKMKGKEKELSFLSHYHEKGGSGE